MRTCKEINPKLFGVKHRLASYCKLKWDKKTCSCLPIYVYSPREQREFRIKVEPLNVHPATKEVLPFAWTCFWVEERYTDNKGDVNWNLITPWNNKEFAHVSSIPFASLMAKETAASCLWNLLDHIVAFFHFYTTDEVALDLRPVKVGQQKVEMEFYPVYTDYDCEALEHTNGTEQLSFEFDLTEFKAWIDDQLLLHHAELRTLVYKKWKSIPSQIRAEVKRNPNITLKFPVTVSMTGWLQDYADSVLEQIAYYVIGTDFAKIDADTVGITAHVWPSAIAELDDVNLDMEDAMDEWFDSFTNFRPFKCINVETENATIV